MDQAPHIIVYDVDQARAALTAASGHYVVLQSPKDAALWQGLGWWLAMMAALRAEFAQARFDGLLDCGDCAGLAMAAIKAGGTRIKVAGSPATLIKLNQQAEGVVRWEGANGAALDLLEAVTPGEMCRTYLQTYFATVAAAG